MSDIPAEIKPDDIPKPGETWYVGTDTKSFTATILAADANSVAFDAQGDWHQLRGLMVLSMDEWRAMDRVRREPARPGVARWIVLLASLAVGAVLAWKAVQP